MKSPIELAVLAAASALLGGCAVYEPAASGDYPYYQSEPIYVERGYGYYSAPAPTYVLPPPVYSPPPPVYVVPPARFRFDFGYWSGTGHRWHDGHRWNGARYWGHPGWGAHFRHR